jgi:hypothetical protein
VAKKRYNTRKGQPNTASGTGRIKTKTKTKSTKPTKPTRKPTPVIDVFGKANKGAAQGLVNQQYGPAMEGLSALEKLIRSQGSTLAEQSRGLFAGQREGLDKRFGQSMDFLQSSVGRRRSDIDTQIGRERSRLADMYDFNTRTQSQRFDTDLARRGRSYDLDKANVEAGGAERQRRAGDYYQKLAQDAQSGLDTQKAIQAQVEGSMQQRQDQSGANLDQAAGAAQAGVAPMEEQGLGGGAQAALAEAVAAQQARLAQANATGDQFAAAQAGNFQGLQQALASAQGMKGGEVHQQIGQETNASIQDILRRKSDELSGIQGRKDETLQSLLMDKLGGEREITQSMGGALRELALGELDQMGELNMGRLESLADLNRAEGETALGMGERFAGQLADVKGSKVDLLGQKGQSMIDILKYLDTQDFEANVTASALTNPNDQKLIHGVPQAQWLQMSPSEQLAWKKSYEGTNKSKPEFKDHYGYTTKQWKKMSPTQRRKAKGAWEKAGKSPSATEAKDPPRVVAKRKATQDEVKRMRKLRAKIDGNWAREGDWDEDPTTPPTRLGKKELTTLMKRDEYEDWEIALAWDLLDEDGRLSPENQKIWQQQGYYTPRRWRAPKVPKRPSHIPDSS